MKYAIIAAGEGSRLVAEGIAEPKPLVRVGGECLLDRLVRIFMQHDADSIVVICNDRMPQVARRLAALQRDGLSGRAVPLRYIVRSTPSSMHSFYELSSYLADGPFVLTTVDTIFREREFADYLEAFRHTAADALMGVTDYIEDESPLYVETDADLRVTAFLDSAPDVPHPYISGGIYGLQPATLQTLHDCMARGQHRMRNFQRALLTDHRRVEAWPFSKVLDIDHASDIRRAEEFVK